MRCGRRKSGGQLGKSPREEAMKDLGVVSVHWRNLEEASYLDPPKLRTREERQTSGGSVGQSEITGKECQAGNFTLV